MELFDTHAHFEGTAEETAAMLGRAFDAGVVRVMAVGGSEELNAGVALAADVAGGRVAAAGTGRRFPEVFRAVGWDRDQVGRELPDLSYDGVRAVGEIGLDYHYSPETRRGQMDLFGRQLELARALDLPVIIHTRDADDDTLGLLREIPSRGVVHSFTGGPEFCRGLLDLGLYVSMSGIVTFRAADNVRESAMVVPDDRLLVETDTPFLAPVPKRGNPNEPAFVVHTAAFLAALRGMTADAFAALATANALAAFRPPAARDAEEPL